ncbi:unnamed protein product [Heligmosomoides polygyrus]|uniref:Dof-type domain-containing protein n=1 Tax=Heligmosomoides polygyrus TaxID=6339 RepID=A0A3P7YFT9_HELPZ|nr:unnamed protein product [Heligmosomoides polygyrus]
MTTTRRRGDTHGITEQDIIDSIDIGDQRERPRMPAVIRSQLVTLTISHGGRFKAPPKGATLPYRPKPTFNSLLVASSAAAAAAAQQQQLAALLQPALLQQAQLAQMSEAMTATNIGLWNDERQLELIQQYAALNNSVLMGAPLLKGANSPAGSAAHKAAGGARFTPY